jgi:hypothetical protein
VEDVAMAATIFPTPGTAGRVERFLSIDERGVGMRASWRPAHGFVNLSLWQGERCVETFHLAPHEVARLTAFLATSLTDAMAPPRPAPPLRAVEHGAAPGGTGRTGPVAAARRSFAARATTLRRLVRRR